jgi:hypothetical protein
VPERAVPAAIRDPELSISRFYLAADKRDYAIKQKADSRRVQVSK